MEHIDRMKAAVRVRAKEMMCKVMLPETIWDVQRESFRPLISREASATG